MEYKVLAMEEVTWRFRCEECTYSFADRGAGETALRRAVDKEYRGWQCGCHKEPESSFRVLLQTKDLRYVWRCLGCASGLSGISKEELVTAAPRGTQR